MRKLALSLVAAFVLLFGTLSRPAFAGGTHEPGDEPPPIICTENCTPPDEGGTTNAVAPSDGSLVVLILDGAVFIYSLL